MGTISGTLSHYGGIYFKSGTNELGESGWWKLLDTSPPEILIARSNIIIVHHAMHILQNINNCMIFVCRQ